MEETWWVFSVHKGEVGWACTLLFDRQSKNRRRRGMGPMYKSQLHYIISESHDDTDKVLGYKNTYPRRLGFMKERFLYKIGEKFHLRIILKAFHHYKELSPNAYCLSKG